MKEDKTNIELAFGALEHLFVTLKNVKADESNRYPLGDPNRIEADLSEVEKAHLDLLRANLEMEIALKVNEAINMASKESAKLGGKLLWLNIGMALLTMAIAASAIIELFK